MKAISVFQPHADLIQWGWQTILMRSWFTPYRGKLLITSAHRFDRSCRLVVNSIKQSKQKKIWDSEILFPDDYDPILGHALAICELVDCRPMKEQDRENSCVLDHWKIQGKYAWVFASTEQIEPIPVQKTSVGCHDAMTDGTVLTIDKLRPRQCDMFSDRPKLSSPTPPPSQDPRENCNAIVEKINKVEQLLLF